MGFSGSSEESTLSFHNIVKREVDLSHTRFYTRICSISLLQTLRTESGPDTPQVEYFHPHNLEVQIEGSYPSILLDTHRVRGHKFLSYVENAWTYVSESKRQNNVYPTKDSSADSTSEVTTPGIPAHRRRESIQRHPSMCVSTCIHGDDKAPDPDSDDQLLDASSLYQEPDIEMTESEEEIFLHEQVTVVSWLINQMIE